MSLTLMGVEEREIWRVAFNGLTSTGCSAQYSAIRADECVEAYRKRLEEDDESAASSEEPEPCGPFGEPVDQRGKA